MGSDNNLSWTSGLSHDGFNLVCNPYPSAIDWDASSGWTKTGLENNIWYRTNSTYATYNGTTHVGVNGGQNYIPALQAYWVHVPDSWGTKGTLKVNNSVRLHNGQSFYKASGDDNVFRLTVIRDTLNDETLVGFYQEAAFNYEAYDSEKMLSTDNDHPQIYTHTSAKEMVAINGQPELQIQELRSVPLGFNTNVAGTFILEATNLNEFDPGISVILRDQNEKKDHDLRIDNTYEFMSNPVSGAERFLLLFWKNSVNIPGDNNKPLVNIFANEEMLTVNLSTPANGLLKIFSVLGQKVLQRSLNQGTNRFYLNFNRGIYIVRVSLGDNITTKKVFIGK